MKIACLDDDINFAEWIWIWICLTTTQVLQDIIRPTRVGVSHSCYHSLNELIKPDYIVQVRELIELRKLHQFRDDSSEGLYRMSDHSYQIEESCFSQEFHYASLRSYRKESIQ